MKPILFLDVDGPLNPYERLDTPPDGYTLHQYTPKGRKTNLRVLLNESHGRKLLELPADVVWATTWRHEANAFVSPRIGLPELPVVDFPDSPSRPDSRLHWKTEYLVEYADGRPFVWIDDECTTYDREYFSRKHAGKADTLLVSPSLGLTSGDFWKLNRKALELTKP